LTTPGQHAQRPSNHSAAAHRPPVERGTVGSRHPVAPRTLSGFAGAGSQLAKRARACDQCSRSQTWTTSNLRRRGLLRSSRSSSSMSVGPLAIANQYPLRVRWATRQLHPLSEPFTTLALVLELDSAPTMLLRTVSLTGTCPRPARSHTRLAIHAVTPWWEAGCGPCGRRG
jgi:hypothetical protein